MLSIKQSNFECKSQTKGGEGWRGEGGGGGQDGEPVQLTVYKAKLRRCGLS